MIILGGRVDDAEEESVVRHSFSILLWGFLVRVLVIERLSLQEEAAKLAAALQAREVAAPLGIRAAGPFLKLRFRV